MNALDAGYPERVYAGVLGKAIGVYLGRPIEGWRHERIVERFGTIDGYLDDELGLPLVVADDDLTGTFTFVRSLRDSGRGRELEAADVARAWLDYVVEGRTVFWWGGVGVSTEHTAYERLRRGIAPPASGSAELNGVVLSEQIGGQIFVDGWALVSPGQPRLAAELARRAASVSHDGEAVHAAQAIAAMEARAFVSDDIQDLLDTGLEQIPPASAISRLVCDLRRWHADEPDWPATRERLAAAHPDDAYPGACHVVPNHARIVLALLYGDGDFARSLSIVNTCGFDTDCNSGNLGCLLGIRNGLAAFESGPDWRGPVRDRLILPTADGGSVVTDAVREAISLAALGHALAGRPFEAPKRGARFSFAFPGAVQGFRVERGDAVVTNERRALEIRLAGAHVEVATPTFVPPSPAGPGAYEVLASPTLYSGQRVVAALRTAPSSTAWVACRPGAGLHPHDPDEAPLWGPATSLEPGAAAEISWQVPDAGGRPIERFVLAFDRPAEASACVLVDRIDWGGAPELVLVPAAGPRRAALDAWVDAVDRVALDEGGAIELASADGRGHLLQGAREWIDYRVSAVLERGDAAVAGIVARAQGLRRYYALLVDGESVALVRMLGEESVLRRVPLAAEPGARVALELEVSRGTLRAACDGRQLGPVRVDGDRLDGGAAGVLCERGSVRVHHLSVRPAGAAQPGSTRPASDALTAAAVSPPPAS